MSKLKSVVNNKEVWDSFLEMLDAKIAIAHKKLEIESTMEGLYRAQGEVAALHRLKHLRDEVNGPKV